MAKGKKTGGRKAGTPNKENKEFKDKMKAALTGRFDEFIGWLDSDELPIKEKINSYLKALEYVMPKQKQVDLNANMKNGVLSVNFSKTQAKPITSENDMFDDD